VSRAPLVNALAEPDATVMPVGLADAGMAAPHK
jgi:hypothetical protein